MAIETWEEFPIGPCEAANQLHVTLSKKGEIHVGAAAFERLGRPEAAVLLFDRTNSRIASQAVWWSTISVSPVI